MFSFARAHFLPPLRLTIIKHTIFRSPPGEKIIYAPVKSAADCDAGGTIKMRFKKKKKRKVADVKREYVSRARAHPPPVDQITQNYEEKGFPPRIAVTFVIF